MCKKLVVKEESSEYNYHPKTNKELKDLIKKLVKERGNEADLNDIDVSKIKDMSEIFKGSQFNGDISKWDVSEVKDMCGMFCGSQFNGDISNWDVSNVEDMCHMFRNSQFNGDISNWDVSNVEDTVWMFIGAKFNGDISKWNVSEVKREEMMLDGSQSNKSSTLSQENVSKVENVCKKPEIKKPKYKYQPKTKKGIKKSYQKN